MPVADDYESLAGRFYRSYIAHPRVARVLGRLIWASDFGPLYRSLDSLRQVEAEVILDIACGAGLALRWLDPSRVGRYVGIDNSPSMLEEARRVARRRGFPAAELGLGDVGDLPVSDGSADLCLLYNSLHCFVGPEAAVAEAARRLVPSGRFVGSMLVRGESGRVDRLMDRAAAKGGRMMGAGGTAADLKRWLTGAGFENLKVSTAGSLATFDARR